MNKVLYIEFDGKTYENIPPVPVFFHWKNPELETACDIHYTGLHNGQWVTMYIPKGFSFSGSVPDAFWQVATHPLDTRLLLGYLLHDYGYAEKGYSRELMDILLKDHSSFTLPKPKEEIIYWPLRIFGWLKRKGGRK